MNQYSLDNDEIGTALGLIFATVTNQKAEGEPKKAKIESKADTSALELSPTSGKKKGPKKKKESHTGATSTCSTGKTYDEPLDDSLIDYGVASKSSPSGPAQNERFYITTAINYTNGHPHMGHAYEAVTTDVIARFHRLAGRQVFFLTGTDEHGQKIANTAEGLGITPIELCDKYVKCFQALNQRLKISNDNYIRTTLPYHQQTCQALWKKCADAGDIYLGKYEGWYNVREETFVTEMEAEALGFKDPTSGVPLKRMSEESYFFRLSKYQDRLKQHITDNPGFIQPEMYKNNIMSRLQEPLGDLSISRTTFSWGIPVPEGFDQKHVMYVWFDALTNYISGVHGLDTAHPDSAFWPAACHIIGKDIVWFHTVIWPCMLMSAQVPLPATVFSHGFINDKDGLKMSKTMGNVIDPHDQLNRLSCDTFRWYLCREAPYGSELSFSEDSLVMMHNSELADTLGNLAHRGLNLLKKYNNGVIPEPIETDVPLPFDLEKTRADVCAAVGAYRIQAACNATMAGYRDVNKWITDLEPWKMKAEDLAPKRLEIVRLAIEALYALAHFMAAFTPDSMTLLFKKIGRDPMASLALKPSFDNIPPGTQTQVGEILFAKLELGGSGEEEKKEVEKKGGKKGGGQEKKKKEGKGKGGDGAGGGKKKEGKKKGGGGAPAAEATSDFALLEIRVGRITKVWEHPEAERLFCEEIDVGEDTPRQIASGLREHYSLAQMEGHRVCVVCNLKPAKLAGFPSAGMVLAACGADGKVELVTPPEGAAVGERVYVEGHSGEPASAAQVKKKKLMEKVSEDLQTNADKIACYQGLPILTSAGPLTVESVENAKIK